MFYLASRRHHRQTSYEYGKENHPIAYQNVRPSSCAITKQRTEDRLKNNSVYRILILLSNFFELFTDVTKQKNIYLTDCFHLFIYIYISFNMYLLIDIIFYLYFLIISTDNFFLILLIHVLFYIFTYTFYFNLHYFTHIFHFIYITFKVFKILIINKGSVEIFINVFLLFVKNFFKLY